jgi:16S rRNA (cytidine1402-2'-O)-methyltransferase
MPNLYVVATPIGNLEDITLRALRILHEVNLIAAEDTRKTRRLLTAYDIKTPLTSYFEYNKLTKLDYIIDSLKEGDVALVSEAGMPGISDPGYELITAAVRLDIPVIPVPGASAVTTALTVSGLPTDRFIFVGFLPNKTASRRRSLESVANESATIIALETPHRLTAALEDIFQVLGDRHITVCRELTKLYEEIFRGTVCQAQKHFTEPRGEFTLVIEGKGLKKPELTEAIERQLLQLYMEGSTAREATTAIAADTGLPKKELYKTWLRLDKVWGTNRDSE